MCIACIISHTNHLLLATWQLVAGRSCSTHTAMDTAIRWWGEQNGRHSWEGCTTHGNQFCCYIVISWSYMCVCLCVSAGYAVPVKFYCVQQPIWSSWRIYVSAPQCVLHLWTHIHTHTHTHTHTHSVCMLVNACADVLQAVWAHFPEDNAVCAVTVCRLFAGAVICLGIQVHTLMSDQLGRAESSVSRASSPNLHV